MKPIVRPFKEEDRSFILSSAGSIPASNRAAVSFLEFALFRGNCLVVCLDDDTDLICGYLITYNNGLVWAFIKSHYRKMGLFNLLFNNAGMINSYCIDGDSKPWRMIRKTKMLRHSPLLMWS
jgi:hypothetical protein